MENKIVEFYRNVLVGLVEPSPVEQLIGMKPIEVVPGHAIFEMDVDRQHSNPQGTLNGGITCTLADIAMGMAFGSTLMPEETFTTIELKINFMKPVWNGTIRAEAKSVKKGKTIGLIDCNVYDENNSLVAHATSTCMVLCGDKAEGR